MESKQPLVIVYNDESIVDTLVAVWRSQDPRYGQKVFIPVYPSTENADNLNEVVEEATKDKDMGHLVCLDLEHPTFEDETEIPKVLEILSTKNPEYWALTVAWNHVEHDASTEEGMEFCKALLDSKVFGTDTEDEKQKWNALWQTINLGNTMCLALAASYRKGGRDGTPFCDFIVSLLDTETEATDTI